MMKFSSFREKVENGSTRSVFKCSFEHSTTLESGKEIEANGFSLRNFGRTSKKIRDPKISQYDPKGIFVIRSSNDSKKHPVFSHPYDHTKRAARIYGTVTLNNPLKLNYDFEYKKNLSEKYGGKTGLSLTKALLKDGYDGIVTDLEIIVFDPSALQVEEVVFQPDK